MRAPHSELFEVGGVAVVDDVREPHRYAIFFGGNHQDESRHRSTCSRLSGRRGVEDLEEPSVSILLNVCEHREIGGRGLANEG